MQSKRVSIPLQFATQALQDSEKYGEIFYETFTARELSNLRGCVHYSALLETNEDVKKKWEAFQEVVRQKQEERYTWTYDIKHFFKSFFQDRSSLPSVTTRIRQKQMEEKSVEKSPKESSRM